MCWSWLFCQIPCRSMDKNSGSPADWYLCDGNNGTIDTVDKFIKCVATAGEAGTTGGSTSHTHSGDSHTHTATGSHNHTYIFNTTTFVPQAGLNAVSTGTHSHTSNTMVSTTPETDSSTFTMSTDNHEPLVTTIFFVRYGLPPVTAIQGVKFEGGRIL